MEDLIKISIIQKIRETVYNLEAMFSDESLLDLIMGWRLHCVSALRNGNKILFAGNGCSAADSPENPAKPCGWSVGTIKEQQYFFLIHTAWVR